MRFRIIANADAPFSTQVLDAETGERIDGVLSAQISLTADSARLVVELAEFEVDFAGEPSKTIKICGFCRGEVERAPRRERGAGAWLADLERRGLAKRAEV